MSAISRWVLVTSLWNIWVSVHSWQLVHTAFLARFCYCLLLTGPSSFVFKEGLEFMVCWFPAWCLKHATKLAFSGISNFLKNNNNKETKNKNKTLSALRMLVYMTVCQSYIGWLINILLLSLFPHVFYTDGFWWITYRIPAIGSFFGEYELYEILNELKPLFQKQRLCFFSRTSLLVLLLFSSSGLRCLVLPFQCNWMLTGFIFLFFMG